MRIFGLVIGLIIGTIVATTNLVKPVFASEYAYCTCDSCTSTSGGTAWCTRLPPSPCEDPPNFQCPPTGGSAILPGNAGWSAASVPVNSAKITLAPGQKVIRRLLSTGDIQVSIVTEEKILQVIKATAPVKMQGTSK